MPSYMTPKLLKDYRDQSSTYEEFFPNGRLHVVCPQCRNPVILYEGLKAEDKAAIAKLQDVDFMKAYEKLRALSECDFLQAKANFLHLRWEGSRCHNCQTTVPEGSLLCPQCMAVNLDW